MEDIFSPVMNLEWFSVDKVADVNGIEIQVVLWGWTEVFGGLTWQQKQKNGTVLLGQSRRLSKSVDDGAGTAVF